jgi:hypothetical protein
MLLETNRLDRETETPLDIRETLGMMVDASTVAEADELFYQIVHQTESRDLQAGYITELEYQLDLLRHDDIEQLMADPSASIIAGAGILRRLYERRSLSQAFGNSNMTMFATRNEKRDDVDLVFTLIDQPDSSQRVAIETKLRGKFDTPCRIEVRDGAVSVLRKEYHQGGWNDVPQRLERDEPGDRILRAVFGDIRWATSLNYNRSAQEREDSDVGALKMLAKHIAQDRSV